MSVLLRTGKDVDLQAVGELHFRSRADAYAEILAPDSLNGSSGASLGEWWTERYRWEKDDHILTVAEQDGRIVGFTYLGPDETPDVAVLNAIHVDPALVGTGLGRDLMLDALPKLATIADHAVLWVLEDNARARRFYERGGWTLDGTTQIEKMGSEDVPMVRYAISLAGGSTRPS